MISIPVMETHSGAFPSIPVIIRTTWKSIVFSVIKPLDPLCKLWNKLRTKKPKQNKSRLFSDRGAWTPLKKSWIRAWTRVALNSGPYDGFLFYVNISALMIGLLYWIPVFAWMQTALNLDQNHNWNSTCFHLKSLNCSRKLMHFLSITAKCYQWWGVVS